MVEGVEYNSISKYILTKQKAFKQIWFFFHMAKVFVSEEDFSYYSFLLGDKILKSGFKPDYLVGVWRGGTPVGIRVHEYLSRYGINPIHLAIRTNGYRRPGELKKKIAVSGLDYLVHNANHQDSLLICDDVYDTGKSGEAIINRLFEEMRRNMPHDVRFATIYHKPEKNLTDRIPDYSIIEAKVDDWIYFPHELEDLRGKELYEAKGQRIAELILKRDAEFGVK